MKYSLPFSIKVIAISINTSIAYQKFRVKTHIFAKFDANGNFLKGFNEAFSRRASQNLNVG
jgi:hypothetical protein